MIRHLYLGILMLGLMVGMPHVLGVAEAVESIKIGYIDAQEVLESTKLGQKAKANLDEYVKSREKILEIERRDLKELEESLAKQSALLNSQAKREKQQEYQGKLDRFQRKVLELNREVQDKQVELVREFRKELEGIVKKIAKREGYSFILDKDTVSGNILYADEGFDLTEMIIAELDKVTE
jgi:outer membrane protein